MGHHGGVNDSTLDPTTQPDVDAGDADVVDAEDADAEAAEAAAEAAVADVPPAAPTATVHRENRIAAFGAIGLALILAFGGGYVVGRGTAPAGGLEPIAGASVAPGASAGASASAGTVASDGPGLPSDGTRLGTADAKVVIDYWADFQCPYCSKFALQTIPLLESRIADGTVALVHRDFAFIGPESEAAAIAVRCAARDGHYWAMHDAVYAAQQGENKGAFARDRLLQIAASVGVDAPSFATCLDEPGVLVDVLDDTAAGHRAGITSTPTIDVNGTRFLGVDDPAKFLAAIDAAAAGASPAPLPTAAPSSDPWSATKTDGRSAGANDAPVTVALWLDYQSTDAKPLVETLGPELRTFLDAGTVRAELHDVATLGDESVVAATYVRCVAAQGGPAWFVSDVLGVSAQGAGSGIYTPANLLRLASKLGLDVRALDTCLNDESVAAEVRAETDAATAAGITAGPTVIVSAGGKEVGRFAAPLDTTKILAAIKAAK